MTKDCLRETAGGGCGTATAALVVAAHESGHGVAAVECGMINVKAEIFTATTGRCTYNYPGGGTPPLSDSLAIAISGPLAEVTFTGDPDRDFYRWRDVETTAFEYRRFAFTRDDATYQAAFRLAEKIVSDRWLTIMRLAYQLARESSININ